MNLITKWLLVYVLEHKHNFHFIIIFDLRCTKWQDDGILYLWLICCLFSCTSWMKPLAIKTFASHPLLLLAVDIWHACSLSHSVVITPHLYQKGSAKKTSKIWMALFPSTIQESIPKHWKMWPYIHLRNWDHPYKNCVHTKWMVPKGAVHNWWHF